MTAGERARHVIKGITGKLDRATQLSWAEWRALGAATLALLGARIRFACRPPQHLIRELRARPSAPAKNQAPDRSELSLERLSWAIATAAAYVPWRSDCLIQAMAADRLLRRSGRLPEFRIGVARGSPGTLTAHAWLICNGITITGGDTSAFTVLIESEPD